MVGRQESCARERAKEHKMFSNTRRNFQLGPRQRIAIKLQRHREVGDLYQRFPSVSVLPFLEIIPKMCNKTAF